MEPYLLEEKCLRYAWDYSEIRTCSINRYGYYMMFSSYFLRNIAIDIYGLPFHKKQIAEKALLFETESVNQISKYLEIKPKILKFKYLNESWYRFKKMDCFCHDKIYNRFYVLEMFTWRDEQEKVTQIQDYCFLLNLAGYRNPIPLFITQDLGTDYSTYKQLPEGNRRFGIPRYTTKGFLAKILNGEFP